MKHIHHLSLVTTANVPEEQKMTLVKAACECGFAIYEKEINERLNRLPFVEGWLIECVEREGPW